MKPIIHYDIPRRSNACSQGQEPLKPGMTYHTMLEESPEGEIVRKDYCIECWNSEKLSGTVNWKSSVPKPPKPAITPAARDESSLMLLKGGECQPEEAFVLALYLSRRKKIALRKETRERNYYEVLATEEIITVSKVPLDQLSISEIQVRLLEKFKNKLEVEVEV